MYDSQQSQGLSFQGTVFVHGVIGVAAPGGLRQQRNESSILNSTLENKKARMTDITQKTISLLKKASDLAAAAYDNDLVEVEIDGAKVSTISLELQLRTMAAKLEHRCRTSRKELMPVPDEGRTRAGATAD
jgi:hypothetical protein